MCSSSGHQSHEPGTTLNARPADGFIGDDLRVDDDPVGVARSFLTAVADLVFD
jgi:hypothetical protein